MAGQQPTGQGSPQAEGGSPTQSKLVWGGENWGGEGGGGREAGEGGCWAGPLPEPSDLRGGAMLGRRQPSSLPWEPGGGVRGRSDHPACCPGCRISREAPPGPVRVGEGRLAPPPAPPAATGPPCTSAVGCLRGALLPRYLQPARCRAVSGRDLPLLPLPPGWAEQWLQRETSKHATHGGWTGQGAVASYSLSA